MSYFLTEEQELIRNVARQFAEEEVEPLDIEMDREEALPLSLIKRAAELNFFALGTPVEYGGTGTDFTTECIVLEEIAKASPALAGLLSVQIGLCPSCISTLGTEAQKRKYLPDAASGKRLIAFSQTEPVGAINIMNHQTRLTPDGDGYRINGHKWFTTGGGDAAFLIVMARTSDDPKRGASMFVVDRHAEGVEHVRDVPVFAEPLLAHREAEIRFHDVRVGPDAVLGAIGDGFRLAQARLVPARLTHCMRWLGLAERAMSLCKHYVATRKSFGKDLMHHQLIQAMFARNAAAIHAGNLMTFHCAWMLEQGKDCEARPYSSMTKTHVARLLCQVLDDAIQMHGAKGFSDDLPFGTWYRHARAARIADGPDEVHEIVVAREFLAGNLELLV